MKWGRSIEVFNGKWVLFAVNDLSYMHVMGGGGYLQRIAGVDAEWGDGRWGGYLQRIAGVDAEWGDGRWGGTYSTYLELMLSEVMGGGGVLTAHIWSWCWVRWWEVGGYLQRIAGVDAEWGDGRWGGYLQRIAGVDAEWGDGRWGGTYSTYLELMLCEVMGGGGYLQRVAGVDAEWGDGRWGLSIHPGEDSTEVRLVTRTPLPLTSFDSHTCSWLLNGKDSDIRKKYHFKTTNTRSEGYWSSMH